MKRLIRQVTWFAWCGPWLALQAQQPTSPTRQELQNTVAILEHQVAAQQDRVDTVTAKLKATDDQIERRVARVLGYAVTVTDSLDSGTKVLRAKQDLFDGLKCNLEFYGRERGQRFAALYRPSSWATREGLAKDVLWLNGRIETRVDQALALVGSLPAERAIARYETSSNNRGYSYERTNPAYAHQERVMIQGKLMREKAVTDLKASIERLGRARLELQRALGAARTDEGRKFIQDLIQQADDLVAKRRDQVQAGILQSKPASQPLGKAAADALVKMIDEERVNYKKDNAEWVRLKNERDVERDRLHIAQDRLAYGQKLLAAK